MNYMFLILKNRLVLFSKNKLFFAWVTDDSTGQTILFLFCWLHKSLLCHLLIEMVLLIIYLYKGRLKRKEKERDFDFMVVLLASKNLKIIWKYDKRLKNYMLFLSKILIKIISFFDQTYENFTLCDLR